MEERKWIPEVAEMIIRIIIFLLSTHTLGTPHSTKFGHSTNSTARYTKTTAIIPFRIRY